MVGALRLSFLQRRRKSILALIVDNYDSFTYNIDHYLSSIDGCETLVVKNDGISLHEVEALHSDFVILSPGPGHPGVDRNFGVCSQLLEHYDRPILGICLGHQGLALHFGAGIQRAPVPVHGQTSAIYHDRSELFEGIPQAFQAVRYHSLVVNPELSEDLRLIAWTQQDGLPMGVRHRRLPIWGVQFHPESICTQFGKRLLSNFVSMATKENRRASPQNPSLESYSPIADRRTNEGYCNVQRRLDLYHNPEDIFVGMYANAEQAFWLDSSRVEQGLSRFAFLGAPSEKDGLVIRYWSATQSLEVSRHGGHESHTASVLEFLEGELEKRRCDTPDLQFDFNCGFVGYFGYELKRECGAAGPYKAETPDAVWMLADRLIVVDCLTRNITLVALTPTDDREDAELWLDDTEVQLKQLAPAPPLRSPPTELTATFRLHRDRQRYIEDIAQCMDAINAGESYEICLTNHLESDSIDDPLLAYRVLRRRNPAPYASFLRMGDLSVLCSSPERFIKIDRDRRVTSKPIKGTVARHSDEVKDAEAALALSASTKDRAENLMIVDLLRNDLSRVCEAGSVNVPKLMHVESYATVHQLVSTVQGRLQQHRNAIDCFRACFPGGSMTGAPKLRTMEIIDALEQHPRGIYSGNIGFLALNGTADLNIVIRTAVVTPDRTTIGVGGAIVALSDPEAEFAEIMLKGMALIEAITEAKGARGYSIEGDKAYGDEPKYVRSQ